MKRKTIRKHSDFLTPLTCISVNTDVFTVKIKPITIQRDARYGIIVSKKFFKLSTERNRAKRLLRNWIEHNEDLMLDKYDYIFLTKYLILSTNHSNGCAIMKNALEQISALSK